MRPVITLAAALCFSACSDSEELGDGALTKERAASKKTETTAPSVPPAPVEPPHPEDTGSNTEIHATY
jgi:hypothetical protein